MISELLITYIFDSLDKQIIKKIPYALLFSLLMYLTVDIKHVLFLLIAISLITFMSSTILFDITINRALEDILININFKGMIEKIRDIIEGKISILDDIKAQETIRIAALGVLSGLFFTVLFSSSFLMLLYDLNLGNGFIIPSTIFLLIYVYQDLAKADLLKEHQPKEEAPLYDIVEAYLVDNVLEKLPKKALKTTILKLLGRIFGPPCHLKAIKIYHDILLIYMNEDVVSLIKGLMENKKGLRLKYEQGQQVENFFTSSSGTIHSITYLREKSPKEVFPYFFNPNYLGQNQTRDQEKWMALSIIENDKVRGYLFIHMFKGIYSKTRIKKSPSRPTREEYRVKNVLLMIFIGESKYVKYLKTRVEILSTKYPQNLMDVEIE